MAKIGRPLAMSIDERRKEIFSITEKLLSERGFEHVTMSDIASAAGMSKKTLYVYFKDKKELLKDLILSSYIWSEHAFHEEHQDAIQVLKYRLRVCAEHVLSERHIKLCRLVILEHMQIDQLTTTFYEMGISTSRNHLIEAIQSIDPDRFIVKLDAEILADMLFGASIAKPFVDILMANQDINFKQIFNTIEQTVNALFV